MLPLKPSKMINLTSGEFCGEKRSGDLFSPPRINFLAIDAIYQNFHNLLCLMTCYSTFCLILIKTVICQIVEHFFLVSTEQSVDFKRRWNLRQMFQIELGSHKWSDLMKSKNGSLHFGEGRSCCPLQTCTLMIIKKMLWQSSFLFLIKVSKQCMITASSAVSADILFILGLP